MAYTQKSICHPTIDVCVPYFYDKQVQLFGNNKRKFFWGMRLDMNDKVELSRRTTITIAGFDHLISKAMLSLFTSHWLIH